MPYIVAFYGSGSDSNRNISLKQKPEKTIAQLNMLPGIYLKLNLSLLSRKNIQGKF